MSGKGLQVKTTALLVFFLWLVVFEKLVNNRIVDHLEKCSLFSDIQYGFRSSRSTADLLNVVSDRIARGFNRSGATQAVAISGQIIGLISSFLSHGWFRVVLDGKSSQEYPVNAGVPPSSIVGPTPHLLYINDFPNDAICDIAISTDDTTLYSSVIRHLICSNNLNWLLNLNLIYETLWSRAGSGLLISMLGKLNWFSFAGLITMALLM